MDIGFLFDNDGVLIDSQEFHWKSWQELMKNQNHFFLDEKTFLATFGKRNDLILKQVLPKATDEEIAEIAEEKEALFRQLIKGKIKLLPGMENFLISLKQNNVPRIIASSTPIANLKLFLSDTILGQYFDHFVSAEEVAHGKPYPDVFLEAAKRIGYDPKKCIVIEDAPVGIEAGKKAGCYVIALETTHSKESLMAADLIYKGPSELNYKKIIANIGPRSL